MSNGAQGVFPVRCSPKLPSNDRAGVPHLPQRDALPRVPSVPLGSGSRNAENSLCETRWETCQRFQSLERGVIPPQDLLPNGKRFPRG